MMISPAYAYEKAPDQEHFLGVRADPRAVPRGIRGRARASAGGSTTRPLFLDFLEGKVDFGCTAWGIPSYSLFGWQRPCYLMSDGYAQTYKELIETTDWERYGRGRDPRCENCMAHCGYEPTAVSTRARSLKPSVTRHRAKANGVRVLVVEDESKLANLLREGLRRAGHGSRHRRHRR